MSSIDRPVGGSTSDFAHIGGAGLEVWYIANCVDSFALTTGAPTANVLRAMPFIAPKRGGIIDRIGYNITGTIAGNSRIGLYNSTSDSNNYPAGLLADSGSQVNANALFKITVSVSLVPGRLYYVAMVGDVAPTIRGLSMASCGHLLGSDNTFGTALNVGISVAHVFAALPNPFTAGGAMISALPIPALYYRFSA